MNYDNVLVKDVCCPFCYATEGRSLYTVTASDAATHFVLPWQNPQRYKQLENHLINLWNQNTCQVISCLSCAGAFSWPFVAGDKHFYDLAYERTGYPQEKWEFKRALDWLLQEIKNSQLSEKNILEIGAGNGAFIKKIIAAGGDPENIATIEYSDMGRQKLEELKLKYVSSVPIPSDELLVNWKDRFDFIFMFQVLEHLDNLDVKMNFLRSCLRPQGQIILAVPNPNTIYFNEINDALLDMPPNHISRLNEAAINKLANRNLFEVKLVEVEPVEKEKEFQEFGDYRYLRRMQYPQTVASLISRLPSKWKIRELGRRLYRAITWPLEAIYLAKIKDEIKEGSSQIAVLQKM